ncbi:hypothetical protein HBA55_18910 [Pseudomaricurvus alkylphenolicus]|uniref:hypothetical protein n=1 Tax=Pseudomaricurvus alkylphenolicus TaxID=1306991 RepID=UPI00141DBB68|nr:hypothetical protein [Pseudomaricurvus alkylphenolicus]NIB41683.1 hypothetical protein [Pseudomaricurvus alkylphenolicus]
MKSMIWVVVLFLLGFGLQAQEVSYAAQVSVKTKYLGKLGTTVDDHAVLQPYIGASHDNGWYGYLWLNIPLEDGNPRRSFEVEPSIGYRRQLGDWQWDLSLTLFDIQNPRVLDFVGDILSPKVMLSRGGWYLEAIHYEADGADDGHLFGGGGHWRLEGGLELEASLSYVDGPFAYDPIVYGKAKAAWSLPIAGISVFVEALAILQERNPQEPRRDQLAVGLTYAY